MAGRCSLVPRARWWRRGSAGQRRRWALWRALARGFALTRPSLTGLRGSCAARCTIRACTPPARSCTSIVPSSVTGPGLPALMPPGMAGRIPYAHAITVRMLLGHRSGVAEWDTPDVDEYIARHPAKIWTLEEILALAAKHPPVFAPGTGFF